MADNNVVNNGKDGAGQSTEDVCRDYLRNVCYRGKTCKYLHPDINEGLDSCWGTTPWPLPAIRCLDQMRMYEIHTNQMVLNFCLHEFNTVVNPSLISIILGFHCLNTRSWGRMKSMPVPEPSL
ncbi:uncharacterized protein LOC144672709 isoform X4 [Cetorhinus maximus]